MPTSESLSAIIAHEMVHNWPVMTQPSSRHVLDNVLWFTEGIATYYTWLLLFRKGYTTKENFVRELNELSVTYFTNPHINWPDEKIQCHFWDDFLAQQLPYHRGFMYFLRLNDLILENSEGSRSLENAVKDFSVLNAERSRQSTARWMDILVDKFLPPSEVYHEYLSMISENTLRPYGTGSLNLGLEMLNTTCEQFDLGFDMDSLNTHIITGLRESSRAAQSGLRDGDSILAKFDLDNSLKNRFTYLTLEICRHGQSVNITYLPRSFVTVECYFVEVLATRFWFNLCSDDPFNHNFEDQDLYSACSVDNSPFSGLTVGSETETGNWTSFWLSASNLQIENSPQAPIEFTS